MLFNSYAFVFLFLPIVLAGSFLLARHGPRACAAWLVLASVFFYGWWDIRYVPLLIGSVVFNHFAGIAIASRAERGAGRARGVLIGAIAVNLALLGYFKYAGFFVANANALLGGGLQVKEIVLPLGISFFTFTQIAYLVDVYREPVRYRLVPYALFVTYFPHLVAGPILHHREMMPQFASATSYRLDLTNLAAGLTLFAIGLFKKTVLADGIAPHAGPVFEHAAQGYAPGTVEAWGAALAYGLQLYFDFSGYSDMAVGMSKMLGIRLPVNFDSPYKARSIIEFWRRWHMTLSRFLRDYLYIALGGSRRGTLRRYVNLLLTMVLGGLWHGAAWTFVVWGAVHGLLLAFNHAWRALRRRSGDIPAWLSTAEGVAGAVLTFLAVFAAWVLFRAEDLPSAVLILRGMVGLNGNSLPPSWLVDIGDAARWFSRSAPLPLPLREWIGLRFGAVDVAVPRGLGEGRSAGVLINNAQVLWIGALLAIAWLAPNTRQIMAGADAFIPDRRLQPAPTALRWRMNRRWAIATAALLVAAVASMTRISEFLYFQF